MTSSHRLQYAERASAEEFRGHESRGGNFDVLSIADDARSEVQIFMRESMLGCASDLAQVFNMHAKDSQFLGLLDKFLTAADDPNRDTFADLSRGVASFHAACCPACGLYRPDEDYWADIDGRLMCASCADDEAARHGADMDAARLDAADHEYDRRAEVA